MKKQNLHSKIKEHSLNFAQFDERNSELRLFRQLKVRSMTKLMFKEERNFHCFRETKFFRNRFEYYSI